MKNYHEELYEDYTDPASVVIDELSEIDYVEHLKIILKSHMGHFLETGEISKVGLEASRLDFDELIKRYDADIEAKMIINFAKDRLFGAICCFKDNTALALRHIEETLGYVERIRTIFD